MTAELQTSIEEIKHGLWVERYRSFNYVALVFERARLRLALETFWEEMEGELVELREMHGGYLGGRVAELRDGACGAF